MRHNLQLGNSWTKFFPFPAMYSYLVHYFFPLRTWRPSFVFIQGSDRAKSQTSTSNMVWLIMHEAVIKGHLLLGQRFLSPLVPFDQSVSLCNLSRDLSLHVLFLLLWEDNPHWTQDVTPFLPPSPGFLLATSILEPSLLQQFFFFLIF